MKKFFSGLIVGVIIMITTPVIGSVYKSINVYFDKVTLMVNDELVDEETILYEGTTYVPLRAISEMLGKEVTYDVETSTAHIDEKGTNRTFIYEIKEETLFTSVTANDLIGEWEGLYIFDKFENAYEEIDLSKPGFTNETFRYYEDGSFIRQRSREDYYQTSIGDYTVIDNIIYESYENNQDVVSSGSREVNVKMSLDKDILYFFITEDDEEVIYAYYKK